MKKPALIILLLILHISGSAQTQFQGYLIDLGRFKLPFDNRGSIYFSYDGVPGYVLGTYDGKVVLFSGGFLISGYRANHLWLNANLSSALVADYLPGPVGFPSNDSRNKIYVIKSTDTVFGKSWQEYKSAVQLGASYYDGNKDGEYNPIDINGNGKWDMNEDCPDILGDITAWCVYNDGLPKHMRRWNWNEPEGIEIHQTVFGFYGKDVVFIRYRIINRGTKASVLDSVIFSAWADFDIGDAYDDLAGCDTLLSLGYSYNLETDNEYGNNPPSIGMTLLQGPYAYIPGESFIDVNANRKFDDSIDVAIDTAVMKNGNLIKSVLIPGARNQNVLSITGHRIYWGYFYPYNNYDMRCFQKGYDFYCSKINPCTFIGAHVFGNIDCNLVNPVYYFSGDPVKRVGWIDTTAGDKRIMVNTGEFTLEKDKPVDIWVAYVVGRGNDNLTSITKMKRNSALAKSYHEDLPIITFTEPPISLAPEYFMLYQNYPNPFNPITRIRYDIPKVGSRSTMPVSLKVYDILGNEIAELVNEEQRPGSYEVIFDAASIGGLSSGVYIYKIKTIGYMRYRKMMLIK